MSLRLRESEPLDTALRRLAMESIDLALASLNGREGRDVAIHTVRKQCKQLRALLRLFRGGLGEVYTVEARFLRDLARSLAAARDAAVALDVHAALIKRFSASIHPAVGAVIRQALIADFHRLVTLPGAQLRKPLDYDVLRAHLLAARGRGRRLVLKSRDEGMLERGLVQSYKKARNAMLHSAETRAARDLHALRKYAKRYWYQLELVAKRWPDLALERTAPVRRLTELLGDLQDMVVYREAIQRVAAERAREAVEILGALAEQRRRAVEHEAVGLAQLVFSERPKQLKTKLRRLDDLDQASS
jgi:CHAD domain-containing protein